ncbi:MAG: hypothetical protein ACI4XN_04290 [Candidatus Kurthia intestinigallinarum]
MVNYMGEIANLLGVELGEEFEIDCNDYGTIPAVIDEAGLFITDLTLSKCGPPSGELLQDILVGRYTIKRKPWRPKDKENFYFVAPNGYVICDPWDNGDSYNINFYKLGNCYRTKAEAEANRDKWVSFYASDEILEV